jgi:uncharacterized protein DUF3606
MTPQHYHGAHDRSRIDAANDDENRWWANELGVTSVALFRGGTGRAWVADVRRHLDKALAGDRPTLSVIA